MSFEKTMVDYIKDLLGNRFKGYRIFIFSTTIAIASVVNYNYNIFSQIFCKRSGAFCDNESSEITSLFFFMFSIIVFVCRLYTDTPAGEITRFHKRLKKGYKDEVLKLTKK